MRNPSTWVSPQSPAQLLHHLNDLVDPGRANRMPARLEPAARANRDTSRRRDRPVQAKLYAPAGLGETAGFQ